MRAFIAGLSILTLAGAAFVHAESLGEVAEREKEKRKGKKEAPVVTETELGRAKGRGVSLTDGNGNPAPAPDDAKPGDAKPGDAKAGDKAKEKTPDEVAAEAVAAKKKEWQSRVDAQNKTIAGIQAQMTDIESTPAAFNDMSRPAQLDALRAKLAAEQAVLANLQDEGRRIH